jgi:CRISPR type III-associated protein (TIGR04423 family)
MNITEIPKDLTYTGYIWMSDSSRPTQYLQPTRLGDVLCVSDESNPFIVEGQLYSKTAEKSYSIKYVDGKHIVKDYDLKLLPEEYDLKKFIPNRIDGVSKILFRQYWKPREDKLCEGMDVLVPADYVFVGFEYSKEKEDN